MQDSFQVQVPSKASHDRTGAESDMRPNRELAHRLHVQGNLKDHT